MMSARVEPYVTQGGFVYVNGIRTTWDEGNDRRNQIQRIICGAVNFEYNSTADNRTFNELVGKVGLTALNPLFALAPGQNPLKQYQNIQASKDKLAEYIAIKIVRFLVDNPLAPFTMILHSQGADIGEQALLKIQPHLRGRIRAITLGGKSIIPEHLCEFVINFQLNWDPVPGLIASMHNVDGERNIRSIHCNRSSLAAHSAENYLNHEEVQWVLSQLAQPVFYSFRNGQIVNVRSRVHNLNFWKSLI